MDYEELSLEKINGLIMEAINKSDGEYSDINGYEMEELFWKDDNNILGYIVNLEDDFGGEGMGDTKYMVFSFAHETKPDEKTYIKFNGYYDSWNGTEWESGFSITHPQEVTVIEWM